MYIFISVAYLGGGVIRVLKHPPSISYTHTYYNNFYQLWFLLMYYDYGVGVEPPLLVMTLLNVKTPP